MLYDIPIRTGRKIDTDDAGAAGPRGPEHRRRSRTPAANPAETARLVAEAPDGFELYSGDDALTLPLLAVGAVGVIGVATHWARPSMAEMIAAFEKGDVDTARRGQRPAARRPTTSRPATARRNPVPTKAMLRALGLPVGAVPACRWARRPTGLEDRARAGSSAGSEAARVATWPSRSASRSSAGWARSAATAPASRSTAASCSSTAGSCSPTPTCSGVDLVLPDFTYLRENADRIEGCIVTHGHEDHVGGLSFLLRELSFPIYGSALTLGLARNRIEEAGLLDRTELIPVRDGERRQIGPFDSSSSRSPTRCPTGSPPPSTRRRARSCTPATSSSTSRPVDGRLTDLGAHRAPSPQDEGIRLLLSRLHQRRRARPLPQSETSVGEVLYDLFHAHEGRRIVTACFASHIHRIQQIADAAIAFGRVVATLGLSMKKNVRLAREMGLLRHPRPHAASTSRTSTTSTPARCA